MCSVKKIEVKTGQSFFTEVLGSFTLWQGKLEVVCSFTRHFPLIFLSVLHKIHIYWPPIMKIVLIMFV